MSKADLRTQAIVLSRTNYGETDRILNLLTPLGLMTAMAKSARKEKSRLAGGIELFCVSDVVLRPSRTELKILSSARMLEFYAQIMTDLPRLTLAYEILKKTNRIAAQIESAELFDLVKQSLQALNQLASTRLIEVWFSLNLARVRGEVVNLYRDSNGEKLEPNLTYFWNLAEAALTPSSRGKITTNHIKLVRLMLHAPLATIGQIQQLEQLLPEIVVIAKNVEG